mmetsp:Transcript_1424/g.4853  ORF Transcript_1424/g.4853 Transcript_1424/m.4853 type:complete len:315 (-) Transcript_1424:1473-2417(-)
MLRGHAGIHEGGVGDGVADEGPADVGEDVLVPVVLEIGEGNGVALLKVAETPLEGDVLEGAVPEVPPHDIRNEATHVGHAGAEVEVEEPVVIDVADVETHRTPRPHCRLHRINKGPVALVQVDPRQAFVLAEAPLDDILFEPRLVLETRVDFSGIRGAVGGEDHVLEAVVIQIRTAHGEAEAGHRQPHVLCLFGPGFLLPSGVQEDLVGAAELRHQDIRPAVGVDVAPHDALRDAALADVGDRGEVFEGAVAAVPEEAARILLVPHVEVHEAIEVEVGPLGGMGALIIQHPGGPSNFGEVAAVVPEQRIRDAER